MKNILVTLIILLFSACALKNSQNGEYKVELVTDSVDKYEFGYGGLLMGPTRPNSPYYESIKKYPEKYIKKNDYHLCMQGHQSYYQTLCEDTTKREEFFNRYKDETFEDWQLKYTIDSLDCIVSICMVEDSAGNEYVIIDENNDEDLSNDNVKEFQTKSYYNDFKDKTYEMYYIDSDVEFEYYNGNEIKNDIYGIRLRYIERGRGAFVQSSQNGKFGEVKLDGTKYLVGVTKSPDIEFSKYDDLWIDLNHNKKCEFKEDYNEQMRLPFTINGVSYKVNKIDRFGKSITIKVCNQDSIPPIAVGLHAPDFCETILDSTEFRLSDYKGKYVILDFWTCSSNRCLPIINKVYNEFKDNDNIGIVTFGLYDKKYLSPKVKEIKINWPHVNKFIKVETRDLYQASVCHETFLISPEGIILSKKIFATGEDIIKMVKEQIN